MILRKYQEEIVSRFTEELKVKGARKLVQAPTGSGKTVIFASIIKRLTEKYPERVKFLIMAHRKELITQAKEKLVAIAPELEEKIGIFSASVGEKNERQITIASPQTLINHDFKAFSIVIVDECHRLPLIGRDSTYEKILNRLFDLNIDTRLLGFTATPYRLGHGHIYGNGSEENWFEKLDYSVTIEFMQENGYLVNDVYKVVTGIETELKKVKKSMGEYNLTELSDIVTKKVHIQSAIDAIHKYAGDRRKLVVFAVSIAHAEVLAEMLGGLPIHSKLGKAVREERLQKFADGEIRFLVNVDILTEGFDEPAIDCVVLLRPSMSTALYVQMVGRGLRLAEGKANCLVLDIAGLYKQHGYFKDIELDFDKEKEDGGEAPNKVCPECATVVHASKMICDCGYEFTADDIENIEGDIAMEDIERDTKVQVWGATTGSHYARSGNKCLMLGVKTSGGIVKSYYVYGRTSHQKKLTKLAKKYLEYVGDEILTYDNFEAICKHGSFFGTAKLYKKNGWTKLRGF